MEKTRRVREERRITGIADRCSAAANASELTSENFVASGTDNQTRYN